jgi:replication-associated recombination protein RarA
MSVSSFDGIIGHDRSLRLLSHALEHPAQAYLFAGPAGVGKRTVAERFARLLLNHPLDQSLDAHPDFIKLEREEGTKEIAVKQARELMNRMSMTSAQGGRKIALILDAQRLSEEAANALLKAVEEPSALAHYIFVSEQPDRLPGTLRSRLVTIPFERVPAKEVEAWLKTQGFSEQQVTRVMTVIRGAPGTAHRWLSDGDEWRARVQQAERLLQTLTTSPAGQQCAALEQITKACESTDDTESAWRDALSLLMQSWIKDHPDASPEAMIRVGEGLVQAWRLVGSSLSPRLGMEWRAVQPFLTRETEVPRFLR